MSKQKFIGIQLLIFVLLIGLLECIARITTTIYYDVKSHAPEGSTKKGYVDSAILGWDRTSNYQGLDACGSYRSFDAHGFLTIDTDEIHDKTKSKIKVAFVGDSNTYGYCVPTDKTFVEEAQRLLPGFSMINLGVMGYSSYQGHRSLVHYGDIVDPDIIVASFNFNDRRAVLGEDGKDSEEKYKRRAANVETLQIIEYSHLFRLIRAAGRKLGIVSEKKSTDSFPLTARVKDTRARVDLASYRDNLRAIAEWGQYRGLPVAFILLGDNPDATDTLRKGIELFEANDLEGAIDKLNLALRRPKQPLDIVASTYLARAYRDNGLAHRVTEVETVTWLDDIAGTRLVALDSDYNRVMREVAQEYGATIIDARSELEKTPQVFVDICHFDLEGHRVVAGLVRDALVGMKAKLAGTANEGRPQ